MLLAIFGLTDLISCLVNGLDAHKGSFGLRDATRDKDYSLSNVGRSDRFYNAQNISRQRDEKKILGI